MKDSDKKLNYFSAIVFLKKFMQGYKKNFIIFYSGWLADSILALILLLTT